MNYAIAILCLEAILVLLVLIGGWMAAGVTREFGQRIARKACADRYGEDFAARHFGEFE